MNISKVRNAVCNINLDMVGLRLRNSKSFMYLYRSGYSTAHYVNDVMESYYRYTGETNVEGITDELGRRGFKRSILSPTGSDDPFYYKIQSLHGSSDNEVFNDWTINVPGIKMGTWPDNYYHTSEDTPDKCDATQLRRAIFIAAAGAYTLALGGGETALRILSEMYSSANARMGIQMAKAGDMIWKSDKQNIKTNYKRAVYNLEGFIMAEISAMEKVRQISLQPQVIGLIENESAKLENLLQIQLSAIREMMLEKCRLLGIPAFELSMEELEKVALKIIPVRAEKAAVIGYDGDSQYISGVSTEILNKYPYRNIINTDEAAGLANGKRNLLQIKKMVDTQFEKETPLQDIINYYTILREAGLMKY